MTSRQQGQSRAARRTPPSRVRVALASLALTCIMGTATGSLPERPLPPEFAFASDSLAPVMHDPARAPWVLSRLTPIIARFPNTAGFRLIRFHALASSGASATVLTSLTDSLVDGRYPTGRVDPPGDLQKAHHCYYLAEILLSRREALNWAETYARRAVRYAYVLDTQFRIDCDELLLRVRRVRTQAKVSPEPGTAHHAR